MTKHQHHLDRKVVRNHHSGTHAVPEWGAPGQRRAVHLHPLLRLLYHAQEGRLHQGKGFCGTSWTISDFFETSRCCNTRTKQSLFIRWSISWRFCTISPTQLPSLYDLRHSTTCVRSQIWWLQFNTTRYNFPVWACSGGLQQGAQGGAWLRRIPGDKDGHFWMWALTLETKDWVAWSCVGKLDCWVELHCKNLSRFKRGRCVGLGEKTKDGLFYWQTCSINAYWCKELDNQLKYFSTESRNAARQSAIAWDQGKTYWIEYFLGAKINHFHWG